MSNRMCMLIIKQMQTTCVIKNLKTKHSQSQNFRRQHCRPPTATFHFDYGLSLLKESKYKG